MKNIKEIKLNNINPNKIGICLGIIIFIVTIFGVTYAYVEPTFYNNEVIGFSAVENTDDKNKIKITDDTSYMRDLLIPINEEDIYKAIDRENICVDDKGHYVCSLYEFTIENTWEAQQKLKLSLYTESNTFGNYYFMLFKSGYNKLSKDNQIVESTHLTQDLIGKDYTFPNVEPLLNPGQKVTYTILFYVKEINGSQTSIDKEKNYTGHINVNSLSTGYSEDDEYWYVGVGPDISGGLVPIKYNGSKWVVTTEDDKDWYNYNKQKWANAAILKNSEDNVVGNELILPDGDTITESQSNVYAMFVWIPRFSYTIGCLNSDTTCYGYRLNDGTDPDTLSATLPGAIDIKFVSIDDELEIPDMDNGIYPNYTYTNETDRIPTNYYTHPAFWWDENGDGVRPEDNSEELAGIWVGKFETTGSSTTPTVLPNVTSLRNQIVSNQFAIAQKFSASGNIYGIDTEKTDGHMMKNSEWSAVAYLSQSIYGKYGNKDYSGANKEIYKNDSSSYYTGRSQGLAPATSSYSSAGTCKYNSVGENRTIGTGQCGPGASTTGNIYGVYDMSGGAYEYVMGYYENATTSYPWGSTSSSNYAGFTTKPGNKYFNGYQNSTIFTKSKEVVGHATYETSAWYSDSNSSISASNPWVSRGGSFATAGSNAGAFNSLYDDGDDSSYYSFRSVLATIVR